MKPLILYYSYSGNTRTIAEMIGKLTGGDLAEIQTVQPYPSDYDATVRQAESEVKKGFEPKIAPLSVNIDEYGAVVIGTPVWWYTFAPPLRTVLSGHRWEGKTIYPFATHGGGMGSTFLDIEKFCVGAGVKPGLDVFFSGSSYRRTEEEIKAWVMQIQ